MGEEQLANAGLEPPDELRVVSEAMRMANEYVRQHEEEVRRSAGPQLRRLESLRRRLARANPPSPMSSARPPSSGHEHNKWLLAAEFGRRCILSTTGLHTVRVSVLDVIESPGRDLHTFSTRPASGSLGAGTGSFSPCGAYVAIGWNDEILLVDLVRRRHVWRAAGSAIRAVSFTSDGRRIVYSQPKELLALAGPERATPDLVGRFDAGEFDGAVACSPDGDTVAAGVVLNPGSDPTYKIGLWSLSRSEMRGLFTRAVSRVPCSRPTRGPAQDDQSPLQRFKFSPDGRFLVAATDGPGAQVALWLFEVEKPPGEPPRWRRLDGAVVTQVPARVGSLDWSSDCKTVAAGCANGTVHIVRV